MGERGEIPDELIDQLLGEYEGPEQLTGPDGLINRLRKRLIERAAGAELGQHLGYPARGEPGEAQPNRRNGVSQKTLRTVDGPLSVELPRDRDGSFEPRIVPKHARTFDGFDEQILALYAGGMTTREIQRHLRELYGVDVSDGLISEVTASIQDDVRAWQSRPLEQLYVAVYLDAMQVAIRDQQVVRKKAVYVAIGVTLDGARDVLGLWVEKTEGARFWTSVMTELRNRGVTDVLFVCTDGLTGFPEAIDAVFPQAVNQACVVHLVRQSLRTCPGRSARAAPASSGGSTPPPTPTKPARCSTSSRAPGPTARRRPRRCRSGSGPGTASSRSSPSRRRSAASSTPPTPSRACTCRSARRSRREATSPTTTPPCG